METRATQCGKNVECNLSSNSRIAGKLPVELKFTKALWLGSYPINDVYDVKYVVRIICLSKKIKCRK